MKIGIFHRLYLLESWHKSSNATIINNWIAINQDAMSRFEEILTGGDLRSIGQAGKVVSMVNNQESFDDLFRLLYHPDRKVVMRAADAIEKITGTHPGYLTHHKRDLLELCNAAENIELKWHLSLMVSRVVLTDKEVGAIWMLLTRWATDKQESKIVRVNAIQALYNFLAQHQHLKQDFEQTISEVEQEHIPSLNARIKKLKRAIE